jgi:hypothetical protein
LVAAVFLLLWLTSLRYKHLQRSALVRLTTCVLVGYCLQGKGKPGFWWTCPRYGPAGEDIGWTIWKPWFAASVALGRARTFLMGDETALPGAGAFSLPDFNSAARSLLDEVLHLANAALFSSYCLRRSMQTLTEQRRGSRDEQSLVGLWEIKDSDMLARYASEREHSGTVVRMLNAAIVREAGGSLEVISWASLRPFFLEIDVEKLRGEVIRKLANEVTVEEAPAAWTARNASVPMRFQLGSMRFMRSARKVVLQRQQSIMSGCRPLGAVRQPQLPMLADDPRSDSQASLDPAAGADALEEPAGDSGSCVAVCATLPIHSAISAGPSRPLRWSVTSSKGKERAHLLKDSGAPYCRRRQGGDQCLKDVCGAGEMAEGLVSLGLRRDQLCDRCLSKSPAEISRLALRCVLP